MHGRFSFVALFLRRGGLGEPRFDAEQNVIARAPKKPKTMCPRPVRQVGSTHILRAWLDHRR